MKYIKTFENINDTRFKSKDDWKVGDVIVATKDRYAGNSNWLIRDEKYIIIEIEKNDQLVENRVLVEDMNGKRLYFHFWLSDFIDLEQWEVLHTIDKYNL